MSEQIIYLQQVRNSANVTLDLLLANINSNVANSAVSANGGLILAVGNTNFNNTATINVSLTANGTNQVNVALNANLTSIVGPTLAVAEAAYAQANSAETLATNIIPFVEDAYNTANNGVLIGEAAYSQANTATTVAQAAYAQANGAVAITTFVSGANGYIEWSNGYIEQWGQSTFSSGGTVVDFPTSFPTACFNIQATRQGTGPDAPSEGVVPGGRAHFTGYIGAGDDTVFYWRANGN